jgi:hypothetical protein
MVENPIAWDFISSPLESQDFSQLKDIGRIMLDSTKNYIHALNQQEIQRISAFEDFLKNCEDVITLRQIILILEDFEAFVLTKAHTVELLADIDIVDQLTMTDNLLAAYNEVIASLKKADSLFSIVEINEACQLFIEDFEKQKVSSYRS